MALKVSENIAQEREGLVQELSLVKALNTKMLDNQDLLLGSAATNGANGSNGQLNEEAFLALPSKV